MVALVLEKVPVEVLLLAAKMAMELFGWWVLHRRVDIALISPQVVDLSKICLIL